jgi:hypothetical protein
VLFLTARAEFMTHSVTLLRRFVEEIPVIRVDARSYRELQANAELGLSPWSTPILALVNLDFAKLDHIASSLVDVEWDLTVICDAQRVVGLRRRFVNHLVDLNATDRLLLLGDTRTSVHSFDSVPDLNVVEWTYDLLDWDGSSLFPTPRQLEVVIYNRTREEMEFLNRLMESLPETTEDQGSFRRLLLLGAASSSLYAAEQSLRRWRGRLAYGKSFDHLGIDPALAEEASVEELPLDQSNLEDASIDADREGAQAQLAMVEDLLAALDRIPADRKFEVLMELMDQLFSRNPGYRVCIFSSFAETVYYLYSSLKEPNPDSRPRYPGEDVYHLLGSMAYDERDHVLHRFAETGRVLVTTPAGLSDLDLVRVDVGISYDAPVNPVEIKQRWAVLDRPRRKSPVVMYILRGDPPIIPREETALRLFKLTESRSAC